MRIINIVYDKRKNSQMQYCDFPNLNYVFEKLQKKILYFFAGLLKTVNVSMRRPFKVELSDTGYKGDKTELSGPFVERPVATQSTLQTSELGTWS
jgi:hypothetical protein